MTQVERKKKGNSAKVSSVTKKTKDGKEIRITVEEIENGFLITKSTEWHDKKNGYQYETKRAYSATNPLEFDPEESLADAFGK